MYKLKIISSTVRPGRKGPLVVSWAAEQAAAYPEFEVEVLDLAVIGLPLMNEANHPTLRLYEHDHSKNWSAKIDEADAFIFVSAEYDYNYPAPLRNALEYLAHEWAFKAAGIVSYGGISGGARAQTGLRHDLSVLRMVPLPEMVTLPFFAHHISEEAGFVPGESAEKSFDALMKAMLRWTKGLKTIREEKP